MDRVLCREPLSLFNISVTPASNVIRSSSYTPQRGGILEHNFDPANPFSFIPRSKGPLTIIAAGTGCTQQRQRPWAIQRTIEVAGATIEADEGNTWYANRALIDYNNGALGYANERHLLEMQIPLRFTNTMNRPASFVFVNLITNDQNFLLSGNRRLLLVNAQTPALDPWPPTSSRCRSRAYLTICAGHLKNLGNSGSAQDRAGRWDLAVAQ